MPPREARPSDWKWRTIIEPFRVKSVEPIGFTTLREREKLLDRAGYNLFQIPADKILIDLLTDSGTAAMSAKQWGALMRGDESYAGATSFYRFERVVRGLTGYHHVLPVHQGRAAERVLMGIICRPGAVVIANSHFDTTRANVEAAGARALDLPAPEALDSAKPAPFKGDMDLRGLEREIRAIGPKNIPLILMTVTNNSLGGQPASLENLRGVGRIAKRWGIPYFIDAARFAENAYLIKLREKGQGRRSAREIAQEMFRLADGCLMSAKKDAFANIGGFLAFNDGSLLAPARSSLILGEGFPTYGGLAGRDLEAIAQGLEEVTDEHYLSYRIRSIEYLAAGLRRAGVPIVEPPGGHAVYIDAKRFLSRLAPRLYPAQALACELYRVGGVRAVEIGSLMFGKGGKKGFTPAPMELVRLAFPRRVYTQSHVDYLIEVFSALARDRRSIRGLKILRAPAQLPHFTARLALAS